MIAPALAAAVPVDNIPGPAAALIFIILCAALGWRATRHWRNDDDN